MQLLGSETRVRTLAPIAGSSVPLTGYRIAEIAEIPRTKVYEELANLKAAGWVAVVRGPSNQTLWQITDPDVRRLLRRRVRIVFTAELARSAQKRASEAKRVMSRSRRVGPPPGLFQPGFRPKSPGDFKRSPEKDAVLAALGLPISRRAERAP